MPTPDSAADHPATTRPLSVWLPWLAAPAFLLLPIGGCGLAERLHRPAVAVGPHPAPAIGSEPTLRTPPSGGERLPLVPVARVVPANAGHRQVAWGRPAH